MPKYLVQATYSEHGTAMLVEHPQNRADAIRPVIEKLGGKLEQMWYAFGDYHALAIIDMPDNISAVAFSIAAEAAGGVRSFKTTPLMTPEEGIEAMKKAQECGYRPPE